MTSLAHLLLTLVGLTQALQGQQQEAGAPAPKLRSDGDNGDDATITQVQAVNYMKQWRPTEDKVSEDFFKQNAELALKTRELPYAKEVSNHMFLTYVLPYTHFDEPVDNWRPRMYEVLLQFVKNKKTLQEAAEALFPNWSNAFGKQLQFKANMTPQVMAPLTQTLSFGFASCTGMSIFLADAMRAVGIPARVVGTNEWNRPEKGNHNWVEIWMGDHWNFVDAVPTGDMVQWNKTWFKEQASHQTSSPVQNAILSPLWGPEARAAYNMSWRTPLSFVPAIDLTANYADVLPLEESSWAFMPATFIMILLAIVTVTGAGFVYTKNKDIAGELHPLVRAVGSFQWGRPIQKLKDWWSGSERLV